MKGELLALDTVNKTKETDFSVLHLMDMGAWTTSLNVEPRGRQGEWEGKGGGGARKNGVILTCLHFLCLSLPQHVPSHRVLPFAFIVSVS